jgi:hypothetical protein
MQSIITVKNVNGVEYGVGSFEKKTLEGISQQIADGRWRITDKLEISY